MKMFWIALAIIVFLFLCHMEVSINPFSFRLPEWHMGVGVYLIIGGVALIHYHGVSKGVDGVIQHIHTEMTESIKNNSEPVEKPQLQMIYVRAFHDYMHDEDNSDDYTNLYELAAYGIGVQHAHELVEKEGQTNDKTEDQIFEEINSLAQELIQDQKNELERLLSKAEDA